MRAVFDKFPAESVIVETALRAISSAGSDCVLPPPPRRLLLPAKGSRSGGGEGRVPQARGLEGTSSQILSEKNIVMFYSVWYAFKFMYVHVVCTVHCAVYICK